LDVAWRNRNYTRVVKLLEPFDENLNSIDKKKLDYSKPHS